MDDFEAAGIRVYGISYDSPEALKRFADQHSISYDLLADVGSNVIREFGILSTLIDPEKESIGANIYGVPYPGTYVVDEDGVVTEKFFNRHYATRESAGTILDKALGKALVHEESPQAEHRDGRAKITAFLADGNLRLEIKSTLTVRLEMAEGLHIYGKPLPEGFIATEVTVRPAKGVRIGEPVYPPTKPIEFEALGATLNVFEGVVDVAFPITANYELLNWGQERTQKSIQLDVVVRYQACTDKTCYAPETINLTLDVPLAEIIMPSGRRRR